MVWIIIVAVLVVIALAYFVAPKILKKIKSKDGPKKDRASAREQKGQERLQKKEEKRLEKKAKKEKQEDVSTDNPHVFELKGDEFGDEFKPIEDPDTKVNYDNLDFGGDEEFQPKHVEEPSVFSNNINDMFNEFFLDENEEQNQFNNPEDTFELNSNGSVDSLNEDDEIQDFLEEFERIRNGGSTIKDDFENLSPEMKALMISNFLDRKDDI